VHRLLTRTALRLRSESGQATAEYALVIVAAAAVALALILWASNSDVLPAFFDTVIRRVTGVADRGL
jgi:Flp pilus assembly pilin Flp